MSERDHKNKKQKKNWKMSSMNRNLYKLLIIADLKKNCRNSRYVFSIIPRSHALIGGWLGVVSYLSLKV